MTVLQWLQENKWYVAAYFVVVGLVYFDVISQMVHVWSVNDDYSHGFLVPLVSGYFFWMAREKIFRTEANPANWGLIIVAFGVLQLLLGSLASEYFTQRTSLVVVLAGTVIFAMGWQAFVAMRLPILYLLLMVPIPAIVYDTLTIPLKLFVAKVSVKGLIMLGYPVMREGNIIILPNVTLEVADACSGLRSLMSLVALSVAFAFLFQKKAWKQWVLIFSALPVAVFTNIMRVFVTGILAKHYGRVAAEGFFHEFAGFAVFFVAMVLMALIAALLKIGEKRNES